jgi:thymidylate kinase
MTHTPLGSALLRAFESLDRARVDWVVLRGLGSLAGPQDDVDVLVGTSEPPLGSVLAGSGFLRVPPRGRGSHRFPLRAREHEFRAYDAGADAWVELDVVTRVAFGADQEFRSDLGAALLGRRRRADGVSVLATDDEFWYALLHDLLKRGAVPRHRRDALTRLAAAASGGGPVAREIEHLSPGGVQGLRDRVTAGDWDGVVAVGADLRRAWRRRRGLDILVVRGSSAVTSRLPARAPTGLAVALLGPDGAGKTTLAASLRHTIPMPSRYVYLGIWRDSRFEGVLRRLPGARLAVRLATLKGKSGWITVQRRLGRLVLLDRYTVDAEVPGEVIDWKGRVSAKLVRRSCAEPDLMVLLDAPAEVMFARKGEHDVAALRSSREGYLRMAERFAPMVVVDATQQQDEVRRQVTGLVWARWVETQARRTRAVRGSAAQLRVDAVEDRHVDAA